MQVGEFNPSHHQLCADARRTLKFESYELADAVIVEPISTLQFPAIREKNREFNKIRTSGAAEIVNNAVVTGLSVLIPYSAEQGIILDRESSRENRDFFRPELNSSPHEILATKSLWAMFAVSPIDGVIGRQLVDS